MPSASRMMRVISVPLLVESKKATGRRITCAWTVVLMSRIARCAATLTILARPNDVAACTSVAPPLATAIGTRSSERRSPMTLSITNFELAGRTKLATRPLTMPPGGSSATSGVWRFTNFRSHE